MIRPVFLDIESRQNLIQLGRDGSAAHHLARPANALVLLRWDELPRDAKVLLRATTPSALCFACMKKIGSRGSLSSVQVSAFQLSVGASGKAESLVARPYRAQRATSAPLSRMNSASFTKAGQADRVVPSPGLEYHKPNVIRRKLDEEKPKVFIEGYEKLLNSLGDDEAVLFADAVHRPMRRGQSAAGAEQRSSRSSRRAGVTHQHSRRDRRRPGKTGDRGRDHRRRLDDQAAAIVRGALSDAGAHPCFLGQRALSSCQVSCKNCWPCRETHVAALHSNVLPALEPDRTVMGSHAQKRHSQQVLRNFRAVRRCNAQLREKVQQRSPLGSSH